MLFWTGFQQLQRSKKWLQQIPNIVKIEDKDCNSLTVEVGSDTSNKNIKKNEDKPKRKRKQQNQKIKKREEKKKTRKRSWG